MKYPEVTALILAGGKATRLGGIAKHAIVVDGKPIFERQQAVLLPLVADLMISGPPIDERYCTLPDTVEDAGPLGGITSGLCACMTTWMLVVAGDMPFLQPAVIELVLSRAGGDAVACEIDGRPQPLLCLLKQSTFEIVEAAFRGGERKASRVLTHLGLDVRWIREPELRALDPALTCFANVNTPADLQA